MGLMDYFKQRKIGHERLMLPNMQKLEVAEVGLSVFVDQFQFFFHLFEGI